MARRLLKHHQEEARKKIQVAKLINLLHECAEGAREMSPQQVQSAKILLDKSISNAPTEISGPDGGPIEQVGRIELVDLK